MSRQIPTSRSGWGKAANLFFRLPPSRSEAGGIMDLSKRDRHTHAAGIAGLSRLLAATLLLLSFAWLATAPAIADHNPTVPDGAIGLGRFIVSGLKRVPKPPAMMIAFITTGPFQVQIRLTLCQDQ